MTLIIRKVGAFKGETITSNWNLPIPSINHKIKGFECEGIVKDVIWNFRNKEILIIID